MKTYLYFALLALTTVAFSSCVPPTTNTNVANTNTNSNANTTAAAPTAEQLKALETKAYEAYKNKDGQYFQTFMTENFKMTGEKGEQMDKAASIKSVSEHPCQINGFTLSDEKVTPAGPNAAVLTTTVAADGTCEGKPIPTATASTLYVNVGGQWKAAYHGEIPKTGEGMSGSSNSNSANKPPTVTSANNSNAAKPAATATPKPTATPTPKPSPTATPASNNNTTASSSTNSSSNSNANAGSAELNTTLVMAEKTAWQAWKDKQSGPLEDALAKEFFYVNMDGTVLATKADVIKDWTTGDCDVKSFGIENPQTTQVSENVALLTYKGTVAGTCAGTPLKPVLGTTIFVREGTGWKAVYGSSAPAA
ncbi:MAG TPA: nuclear transport factor 2 family protein [Pyrinomonadaceae bacterium]|jgi:hypothetical protein|nr:nuclear transport factor 2 family protein [Pyrinomonadaceae bacterium]